jgi:hypothetical protein
VVTTHHENKRKCSNAGKNHGACRGGALKTASPERLPTIRSVSCVRLIVVLVKDDDGRGQGAKWS